MLIFPQNRFFGIFCLGFSVLWHLCLWFVSDGLKNRSLRSEAVEVVFLSQDIKNTVVSQENFNHEEPEGEAYLSRYNKVVEKQTQAMLKGLFHHSQAEKATSPPPGGRRHPAATASSAKAPHKVSSFSQNAGGFFHVESEAFLASSDLLFQGQKPGQTPDFIAGVEAGSDTLLNTKEFTYYSYYNRMKEQLYWRWTQYLRAEDHLFYLISDKKSLKNKNLFVTRVFALLSREGEVQDVQVVRSSGEEGLDSAALHAFLKAAPFPNPPLDLVRPDGLIPINKTFYVYIPSVGSGLFSKSYSF